MMLFETLIQKGYYHMNQSFKQFMKTDLFAAELFYSKSE